MDYPKRVTFRLTKDDEYFNEAIEIAGKLDRGEQIPEVLGPNYGFQGERQWREFVLDLYSFLEAVRSRDSGEIVEIPTKIIFEHVKFRDVIDRMKEAVGREETKGGGYSKEIGFDSEYEWEEFLIKLNGFMKLHKLGDMLADWNEDPLQPAEL